MSIKTPGTNPVQPRPKPFQDNVHQPRPRPYRDGVYLDGVKQSHGPSPSAESLHHPRITRLLTASRKEYQ